MKFQFFYILQCNFRPSLFNDIQTKINLTLFSFIYLNEMKGEIKDYEKVVS